MPQTPLTEIQIIETEGGERLAVLPLADYERLAAIAAAHAARTVQDAEAETENEAEEDEGTARVVAARRAAAAAAGRTPMPAEIAEARARGESGLRAARKLRGLTQQQLAAAAGIGQGYLSQLEAGERAGPAPTLQSLARALDVDVAWLVGD